MREPENILRSEPGSVQGMPQGDSCIRSHQRRGRRLRTAFLRAEVLCKMGKTGNNAGT
jgi:hypothetical protein